MHAPFEPAVVQPVVVSGRGWPKKSVEGALIDVTPLEPAGNVTVQTPPVLALHGIALIAGDVDWSE